MHLNLTCIHMDVERIGKRKHQLFDLTEDVESRACAPSAHEIGAIH